VFSYTAALLVTLPHYTTPKGIKSK